MRLHPRPRGAGWRIDATVSSLFLYCCLQTSPSPTILLLLCVISSTTSRNHFRKQNILCYTIVIIEFLKHIVQKYTHVSHMFISKRLHTLIIPVYQSLIRYYLLQSINHLKTLLLHEHVNVYL